ncbi:hypothetical protein ACG9XR_07740 [Acinetobacter guillouiae]|uniref:hypothetical protein n=1 Tax=Acinetobacter TaxID=469 RepID=UPI0028D200CE|nr:hypothetical protein [Acinetobacter guillouiae]
MATSLSGSLDLTQIALKIIENTYGLVFISVLLALITFGGFVYLLSKSGVFSSFATYTEHTSKKFHKEIEYKEKLIDDTSLSEFKSAMEHHIKVSKLENFLKYKNKDIDVLKYALLSMDSKRALKLYKRGKDFLVKDPQTKMFKLKEGMTLEKIKRREIFGLCVYIFINLIGAAPYLVQVIITLFRIKGIQWFSLFDQLMIFIAFLILSLIIVAFLFNPRAAQSFLEIEKI